MNDTRRLPTFLAVEVPKIPPLSRSPRRRAPKGDNAQVLSSPKEPKEQPFLPLEEQVLAVPQRPLQHMEVIEWERKYLMQLCTKNGDRMNGLIEDFMQRLHEYPGVAQPILIRQNNSSSELYEPTLLGALCGLDLSSNSDSSRVLTVLNHLLELCPFQVRCSQEQLHHTALRTAACNPTIPPNFLEKLVAVDCKYYDGVSIVHLCDSDGLTPLDHLLYTAQLGAAYQESATLLRLEALLKHTPPLQQLSPSSSSPLLQLLSLGTSLGVQCNNTVGTLPYYLNQSSSDDAFRLDRILKCCKLLLSWNPDLLYQDSRVTGCNVLHVGVRNYGNFAPLIEYLLDLDTSNRNVASPNTFGDLPLHVACSVGVPMDTLTKILVRTRQRTTPTTNDTVVHPHPLVWSINGAGYTPIDLEWIRHIESGENFHSPRSFYPLDARGVRRPAGSYGDSYNVLLRQAADQFLLAAADDEIPSSSDNTDTICDDDDDESAMGLLLQRIFLVVQAAFQCPTTAANRNLILHQASALLGPHGPTIPRPILEIVLTQHPEQVRQRDAFGRLPLHYAVQIRRVREEASTKSRQEWRLFISTLVQKWPEASRVKDWQGRLPLHYALDYPDDYLDEQVDPLRNEVLYELVEQFPGSVEAEDPVLRLYPFQRGALNPLVSLDTVFSLLRKSPGALALSTAATSSHR